MLSNLVKRPCDGIEPPKKRPREGPTAEVVPFLTTLTVTALVRHSRQTWTIGVDLSTTTVGQLKEQLCVQEGLSYD